MSIGELAPLVGGGARIAAARTVEMKRPGDLRLRTPRQPFRVEVGATSARVAFRFLARGA